MRERRSPGFQPDLLTAIGELRKFQTRRLMNPQPMDETPPHQAGPCRWIIKVPSTIEAGKYSTKEMLPPHGQPGTVWALKEPLQQEFTTSDADTPNGCLALYSSDDVVVIDRRTGRPAVYDWQRDSLNSRFMPAWAARDFVTLEAVRVELLQDISEADAIAEGIRWQQHEDEGGHWEVDVPRGTRHAGSGLLQTDDPIEAFMFLWDSINGKKHPWESNPYVWVETFGNYVRDPGRKMP